MSMDEEYVKQLVAARLRTIPQNVGFSVGSHGNYTRDEIIQNVLDGTPLGREFAKMELRMLIESPKLIGRLHGAAASSYPK
jgi:hypothetical protein